MFPNHSLDIFVRLLYFVLIKELMLMLAMVCDLLK